MESGARRRAPAGCPPAARCASAVRNGRPAATVKMRGHRDLVVANRTRDQCGCRHCQICLSASVERVGRADVHPHALHAHAEERPALDRPASHTMLSEKRPAGALEQARMRDRHAGEGERHDSCSPRRRIAAVAVQREVAAALVAEAVSRRAQAASGNPCAHRPRPRSARRLEPTPSIHTESELWIRKGRRRAGQRR